MKSILFPAMLAALVFGANAFAQDAQNTQDQGAREGRRQRLLQKFDADGDGQLNDAEKQALREAIAEHRRAKNGGEAGEAEQGIAHRRYHKLLEYFDTDGDGKLSPEEKQAAREKLQAFRQKHPDRGGRFGHGRGNRAEAAPQDAPPAAKGASASGASEAPVQF